MKKALTIAGSDSSGGAGIQADLKTFAAQGVFGMSVLTAITAQNTIGVQGVFEIPPDFIARQIDSIAGDIGVDVVKTGMLSSSSVISIVASKIREHKLLPVVVDPVMVAKGGGSLLHESAMGALIKELLPLADVVTPNLHEANILCGLEIKNFDEMKEAARLIHKMGPRNVIIKGGHLPKESDAIDILFDGESFQEFHSARIQTKNDHGTGCTFASAIAANLARQMSVTEAVKNAKEYLTNILRASIDLNIGHGRGSMNHTGALHAKEK